MLLELTAAQKKYLYVKRAYDLVLALAILMLSLPLLLLVGIWIKVDSRGGLFYLQRRPGQYNQLFTLLKFRSMRVPEPGHEFVLTQANDPRLTNAGKWLRKLHLDELPQLLNVVAGHMSLVGPRPLPEPLYATYQAEIPTYNLRHVVRPGITGFAQIWQGYTNTMAEEALKWKYDVYYIQQLSFKQDALILWQTVFGGSSKNPQRRAQTREKALANSVIS